MADRTENHESVGEGRQSKPDNVGLQPGGLGEAVVAQDPLGLPVPVAAFTFRIRAYGDVQNPVTNLVESRAWCEAIVQRCPEYTDTADASSVLPGALTAANQTFGRRFTIVSFRWLSADEI